MSKESKLINSLKSRVQIQTPIATDMFIPNHSGKINADTLDGLHAEEIGGITMTTLISRNSTVDRLLADEVYTSAWIDTTDLGGITIFATDNTSGTTGGKLDVAWSTDGINTTMTGGNVVNIFDYAGGYIYTGSLNISERYVRFTYTNYSTDQGTTYPQCFEMQINGVNGLLTNNVNVTNQNIPVIGPADVISYGSIPVIIGGVDNVSTPNTAMPALISGSGYLYANAVVSGDKAHDAADGTVNPIKIGGKAFAIGTAQTAVSAANDRVNAAFDLNGRLHTFDGGYSYNHIASATTTTVKSSAGFLHAIIVNDASAAPSTAKVYDNTAGSGTVIAVIDSSHGIATLDYDITFNTGLTIVTSATCDLTVCYR